jgi:small-conductance mechanosensitive channel
VIDPASADLPTDLPRVVDDQLEITTGALSGLYQSFLGLLPSILVGLLVFGVFYLLAGAVRRAILRATRRSGYGQAVSRLARLGLLLGGLLVGMAIAFPTVNGSSILSALGVSGVAIGFAIQRYFAKLFCRYPAPLA